MGYVNDGSSTEWKFMQPREVSPRGLIGNESQETASRKERRGEHVCAQNAALVSIHAHT